MRTILKLLASGALGGGKSILPVPTGFDYDPGFNIYDDGTSDFDSTVNDFSDTATVTYYFDMVSGVDGNSGLTPAAPKKTIQTVVASLNSSPPANGAVFVLLTDYTNFSFLYNSAITFDVVIKSSVPGTKRIMAQCDPSATFSLTSSDTYVWTKAVSPVSMFVVDKTDLDEFGKPKKMVLLASQAAVEASPTGGVFYRDAGTSSVYFKLWDFRNPTGDSNILCFINRTALTSTGSRLFLQDLIIYSSGQPSWVPATLASPATFTHVNCEFGYSNTNVLNIDAGPTDKVFAISGLAYQGTGDGFNYGKRGADATGPLVFEQDCQAFRNGYGTGVSENGSTTHEGTKTIRLGGRYESNKNRNQHDVNANTQTWMVRCVAKDAQNQLSGDDSVDFMIGTGVSDTSEMWLDACSIEDSNSLTNLKIDGNSVVKYRRMDISGWDVINPTGTLEQY